MASRYLRSTSRRARRPASSSTNATTAGPSPRFAKGRRVLDLFCYTGGFSINALIQGEAALESRYRLPPRRRSSWPDGTRSPTRPVRPDSSWPTSSTPSKPCARSSGEKFGLVICDPPKFARHPKALEDAVKGYLRLNRAAVDVLEPGGILVTCSCSGLVDRTMFLQILGQVAELANRPLQILEQRGQAPDHPDLGLVLGDRIPQMRDRPGLVT